MVPASLGFMFLTCLGIDLVRQRHMKYKARQIVLLRNIRRHTGRDLRELNFQDKLSVFTCLGINLFLSEEF